MGLTDEMARARPRPDLNSVVWLIWHMARSEDVALNTVVAGRPQVLEVDGWADRLGVNRLDIGTGMSEEEVGEFTDRVNVAALRSYRAAVGRRTREVIGGLDVEILQQPAPLNRIEQAFADGAVEAGGRWVQDFWRGKSYGFFLWLGTGHSFMHLGEANLIRSLVGGSRGR